MLQIVVWDFRGEEGNSNKDRKVSKTYIALVRGTISENEATINMPIARSTRDRKKMAVSKNGKEAITEYEKIMSNKKYTMLSLNIKTGRKNIKNSKGKPTSNIQGTLHKVNSWLSSETLQIKRKWQDIFKIMKGENLQTRLLYTSRISFKLMEKSETLCTVG